MRRMAVLTRKPMALHCKLVHSFAVTCTTKMTSNLGFYGEREYRTVNFIVYITLIKAVSWIARSQ